MFHVPASVQPVPRVSRTFDTAHATPVWLPLEFADLFPRQPCRRLPLRTRGKSLGPAVLHTWIWRKFANRFRDLSRSLRYIFHHRAPHTPPLPYIVYIRVHVGAVSIQFPAPLHLVSSRRYRRKRNLTGSRGDSAYATRRAMGASRPWRSKEISPVVTGFRYRTRASSTRIHGGRVVSTVCGIIPRRRQTRTADKRVS